MTMAALILFAVVGVIIWRAICAQQPSQQLLYRRILHTDVMASTIGLVGMRALFFCSGLAPTRPRASWLHFWQFPAPS